MHKKVNAIYCRFAPIRYDINPLELRRAYRLPQANIAPVKEYRKSCQGFISLCVLQIENTHLRIFYIKYLHLNLDMIKYIMEIYAKGDRYAG